MKFELSAQNPVHLSLVPETEAERRQLDQLQADLLARRLETVRWACSRADFGPPLSVGLENRNWH